MSLPSPISSRPPPPPSVRGGSGAPTVSLEERRLAVAARAKPLPLREAWERHLDVARPSMRSKLRSVWKHQIEPVLGELPVVCLTPRQLALWEAKQIEGGYAPKTTRDAFYELAAAVRESLDVGDDYPWRLPRGRYWKPTRKADPLRETACCTTVEELERLVHAALEDDRARRAGLHGEAYARRLCDLGPRVTIAVFIGARNGELAGLGWDDLVRRGPKPLARVCHQAIDQWRTHHPSWTRPLTPPKGGRERRVLLHPTALLALDAQEELLRQRGWYRDDGPVFPSHEGNAFSGTWRNNANGIRPEHMKLLARRAGLPFHGDFVAHSLRHSLATLEHASGADLRAVQSRTGHSSLSQLEAYIHRRTGRAFAPSAIPQLSLTFDLEHDTDKDLGTLGEGDEEGKEKRR